MLIVNNKDTRTTPIVLFCCLYCQLWTYFTPSSSISIVNCEQVNAGWVRQGLHQVKLHAQWLYIVHEERKETFFFILKKNNFFSNLVYSETNSAIIHVRIVNPAGNNERTFNFKWSYRTSGNDCLRYQKYLSTHHWYYQRNTTKFLRNF